MYMYMYMYMCVSNIYIYIYIYTYTCMYIHTSLSLYIIYIYIYIQYIMLCSTAGRCSPPWPSSGTSWRAARAPAPTFGRGDLSPLGGYRGPWVAHLYLEGCPPGVPTGKNTKGTSPEGHFCAPVDPLDGWPPGEVRRAGAPWWQLAAHFGGRPPKTGVVKIYQRGVQWKQAAVIYMMLYTSLSYNDTPIHCTPLPLPPRLISLVAVVVLKTRGELHLLQKGHM